MNADERARRRHLVALPRVAEDCRRTIAAVTQTVDHSGRRPYDHEQETD